MTESQWERVKQATADALELAPEDRTRFVATACGDDPQVVVEVVRLIGQAAAASAEFLSAPPWSVRGFLDRAAQAQPTFSAGEMVSGRFRIERFLNRGGMGEVYAAFDIELKETVALKTIRPAIASSAAVIERFKAEVKQTRRITHPNVCRVYDLFRHERRSSEPLWFLTMEHLAGRTLGEFLADRGPIGLDRALPLIGGMVAALSTAHELGIVHRDFKPGNVMLVGEGTDGERAVVTDFGLAMNVIPDGTECNRAAAEGTPAYMAPEQAMGNGAEFASDQFALGLVIHQMLTGSLLTFSGISAEEWRAQVAERLQEQRRPRIHGRARRTIRRCLEFQPEDRFPHVRNVLPAIGGTRSRYPSWWAAAAACAGAISVMAALIGVAGRGMHVAEAVPLTSETGLSSSPSISKDGKWVAYMSDRAEAGNRDIWIQPTAPGPARRLTTDPARDTDPSISPDGRLVAFRSDRGGGGIYVIGSDGSGERLVAAGGRSPAFSPDGRWIAYWQGTRDDEVRSGQLYLVSSAGGPARRLAAEFADARYPTWASTGRHLLFEGCLERTKAPSTCTDWWVIRPDGSGARNTGTSALLKSQKLEIQTPPMKSWLGDRVFFSGALGNTTAVWALRLSPRDNRPVGAPHRITSGDAREREPSVSASGLIAFVRATGALHIWRLPLKSGEQGSSARVTDGPYLDGCPSISRDGRWLYFTRKIGNVRQLMVRDRVSERDALILTPDEDKFWPVASPDGGRAVFEIRGRTPSIWITARAGLPRQLCAGCSHPTSWFAGERAVLFTTAAGEVALLDTVSGSTRTVLSPGNGVVLGGADWNAANESILFTASRQGAAKQVYAVRFPAATTTPSGPWAPLTQETDEIDQPHWSTDGKTFLFLSKQDGQNCIWGRRFDAAKSEPSGQPFPVAHFHDPRTSPDNASPIARGLTVAADAVYLNVGEVTAAIWTGRLADPPLAAVLRRLYFWQ